MFFCAPYAFSQVGLLSYSENKLSDALHHSYFEDESNVSIGQVTGFLHIPSLYMIFYGLWYRKYRDHSDVFGLISPFFFSIITIWIHYTLQPPVLMYTITQSILLSSTTGS